MRVLGIETSCDETAVSLIEAQGTFESGFSYTTLGNALISQAHLHAQYGGVFPNVAKREHQRNLVPLLKVCLEEAKALPAGSTSIAGDVDTLVSREPDMLAALKPFLESVGRPDIDAIAVTHGPGLEPALWVGINFAKALSQVWNIPLVPVNHMEGHIVLSATAGQEGNKYQVAGIKKNSIKMPLLSLLISGGHTELVLSRMWLQYELLGQTRDDAVGEAFDKVARLMDLPYPGGPEISRLAKTVRENPSFSSSVSLPRPMIDSDNYDFSFSGLKTAVRRLTEGKEMTDAFKTEVAYEFENACADVLVAKTMRAIEEFGVQTVLVGGGVSANTHIRASLADAIKNYGYGTKLLIPPTELATDNALMIALAGYFRAERKEFAELDSVIARGNLKLA